MIRPLALLLATASVVLADGPKDNLADNVRPIPPPGIEVPAAEAEALQAELAKLRAAIDAAAKAQEKNPRLADLLPDVEIHHKAVDWALRYGEVHKPAELKAAREVLAESLERAAQPAALKLVEQGLSPRHRHHDTPLRVPLHQLSFMAHQSHSLCLRL